MSDPGPEPQQFEETAEADLVPAPFGRRVLALLVDCVLSVLAAALFADPQVWSSVVLIAEYTFFTGLFAETPGMRLLGLRCVRLAHGGALGLPRALVRALLLSLVLPAVVTDERGRGYHDRAVRSMVIRAKPTEGRRVSAP